MRQGTKEWLETRKKFIGASDAAVIMNISPFKTPFQLWEIKVGIKEEVSSSPAMARGIAMEPLALRWYEEKTGLLMMDYVAFSHAHPFMMASLDGISMDLKSAVEIKCPGPRDHEMALEGKIPEKYYPQLQHQMIVLDIPSMHYCSFDGVDGVIIPVSRDDEYCSKLIEEEKKFYHLMVSKTPPEFTDRDFVERSDDEWAEKELKLLGLIKERKKIEEEEKSLKKILETMAEGHNILGRYTKFTKVTQPGRVNYSSIPQLQEIDLSVYRGQPVSFYKTTELK